MENSIEYLTNRLLDEHKKSVEAERKYYEVLKMAELFIGRFGFQALQEFKQIIQDK